MATYISLPIIAKAAVFAISLLNCHGCLVVPVSAPPPPQIPINLDNILDEEADTTKLEAGWKKTCYADSLTESEGRKITASSASLEMAADKLAAAGKHREAIRKYNEATAAAINKAMANGSIENMEADTFPYNADELEAFREKHRPLIQSSAESNFKIGSSYARLGKYENAIDCFNSTLKIGILPPNDAIAYLNRGDAHERIGAKDKAKADFQQAANLFKKHKLLAYQELAQKRLQAVTK